MHLGKLKANDEIQSIYLYLEDVDSVISDQYAPYQTINFPDTDWIKQYNLKKSNGGGPFWMNSRIAYNINNSANGKNVQGNNAYVLTYVYPLTSYTTQIKGAIVLNLFEDNVSRQINSTDMENEGYIFVMDTEGIIVSHVDKEMLGRCICSKSGHGMWFASCSFPVTGGELSILSFRISCIDFCFISG
jgi:two-component system, response regulator YesN